MIASLQAMRVREIHRLGRQAWLDRQIAHSDLPDPVVNRLSVYITQQTAGPVRLELWDMGGRLLLKKEGSSPRG